MQPTPITPRLSRTVLAWTLALATPLCLSATPAFAQAHGGGGSHSSGGGHTSSGGSHSGGGSHTSSGATHSGGASGSHATSGGTTRASGSADSSAKSGSTSERSNAAATPQSGRTRNGRPAEGTAVPRTAGRTAGTTGVGVGYTGFYPLGAGLGYGGYYGGYYDPGYGGTDPYYVPPPPAHHDGDGAIRLKITPKQALVYVDGYFAGVVDDFDGLFQKLHLEPGPHHIDVQAEGYESLAFDVQITPDHTLVYEAELRKIQ